MLDGLLAAWLAEIAASPPTLALKTSRYVYPVVNALHIMGLATLFGAILAFDLRLLGVGAGVPLRPLAKYLPRVAACGLAVAVLTGALLFSVKPFDYVDNGAFLIKIGLVLAGTLHAVAVHLSSGWQAQLGGGIEGGVAIGSGLKVSAALSLLIWVAAIVAGRWIAFA